MCSERALPLTLAIDPGPERSGFCFYEPSSFAGELGKIQKWGWVDNAEVLTEIFHFRLTRRQRPVGGSRRDVVVIESIQAVFGTRAGRSLTDTIRAEGRFYQAAGGDDGTCYFQPRTPAARHVSGAPSPNDKAVNDGLESRFGRDAIRAMAAGCGQHARDALALAVYWDEIGQSKHDAEVSSE